MGSWTRGQARYSSGGEVKVGLGTKRRGGEGGWGGHESGVERGVKLGGGDGMKDYGIEQNHLRSRSPAHVYCFYWDQVSDVQYIFVLIISSNLELSS